MRLKGQVALVTGASRGIGEVIALHLAKEGVKVAVNYHTGAEAASMVVSAITSAGGEALPVGADVSQEKDTISMVDQVIQTWGQLDILVNNAGITRDKLLIRMTAEEWDAVINVNLRGAYICTKTALPHMIPAPSGKDSQHLLYCGCVRKPRTSQLCCIQGRPHRVHQSYGSGGSFPEYHRKRCCSWVYHHHHGPTAVRRGPKNVFWTRSLWPVLARQRT